MVKLMISSNPEFVGVELRNKSPLFNSQRVKWLRKAVKYR